MSDRRWHFAHDGTGVIEFSRSAIIASPTGGLFNPFLENSYAARVLFPDDAMVAVELPKGAASRDETEWVARVVEAAKEAHEQYEWWAQVREEED